MMAAAAAPASTAVRCFLAFDFGTRRVGVAIGNSLLRQAQPLKTVAAVGEARLAPSTRWCTNGSLLNWWSACPSTRTAPSTRTPGARVASVASCTDAFACR